MTRRFKVEQHVVVDSEVYQGKVQIVDFDDRNCKEHDLPRYHCQKGDACFTFCEEMLKLCN